MEKMRPKISFHKKHILNAGEKRICDVGRETAKSYEISYEDEMISGEFMRCYFMSQEGKKRIQEI